MTIAHRRLSAVCSLLALVGIVLAGCGGSTNSTPAAVQPEITIQTGQSFAPFILTIQPNSTVKFTNKDTAAHNIKSTPATDPAYLNLDPINLTVAAGASQTQKFTKPGVYDYYDDALGTWDTTDSRVKANDGIPTFPEAVEGIIYVQGNISGLPATATNSVISGKDDFEKDFVAISKGGTVSWHNNDTDKHYVQEATGWTGQINPAKIALLTIKGTADAAPDGETQTHTFDTPGLYYYFCTAHADVDTTNHRVKSHGMTATQTAASEYPIPMEGFVLVV